jgi:Na+/melibiose symporter-like transporter
MILVHMLIGAAVAAGFLLVYHRSRKKQLSVTWWQWGLTVLGFLYAVFVLEMIAAFLDEGAARAALVMGLIFGLFGVIWAVLLARFVFKEGD